MMEFIIKHLLIKVDIPVVMETSNSFLRLQPIAQLSRVHGSVLPLMPIFLVALLLLPSLWGDHHWIVYRSVIGACQIIYRHKLRPRFRFVLRFRFF